MPPTSRPPTPLDQRPSHLRGILPPGLSEQEAALRVARLGRKLGASGGSGGGRLAKGWEDARIDMEGYVEKQRIVSSDPALSDALSLQWQTLARRRNSRAADEADSLATDDKVPEHLSFLLALARPATSETHMLAHALLAQAAAPQPTDRDLWEAEFGLPSPSGREPGADDWQEPDWGSNASDISWDDGLSLHGELSAASSPPSSPASAPVRRAPPARASPEALPPPERPEPYRRSQPQPPAWATKAYYADVRGWEGVCVAPSLCALLAEDAEETLTWKESELVGEVLHALGGRACEAFLRTEQGNYTLLHPTALLHLHPMAVQALLAPLFRTADELYFLTGFVAATLGAAAAPTVSVPDGGSTKLAFAAAVDRVLVAFRLELGAFEAAVMRGDEAPSLLSLGERFDERGRLFSALAQVVRDLSDEPVCFGRALLDALNSLTDALHQEGASSVACAVQAVFLESAEPVWDLVGDVLRSGLPIGPDATSIALDPDFFIVAGPTATVGAAVGWTETYSVDERRLPRLLEHLAGDLLSASKAVGLLRAIGLEGTWYAADHGRARDWRTLTSLVGERDDETLAQRLEVYLAQALQGPQVELQATLRHRCGLSRLLAVIEGVSFLSIGLMGDWTEELFLRIDSGKRWADAYALKSTLREAADALSPAERRHLDLDTIAAFSIGRAHLNRSTVKALAIGVEFEVPFPLSAVFSPASLKARSRIFTLMLQVARARHVLSRLLVLQGLEGLDAQQRKAFVGIRLRLVWIVNVLWRYFATDVLHVQTQHLHQKLEEATTLDELIGSEIEHVRAVKDLCFLSVRTARLHKTVISILDLALRLADLLSAFQAAVDRSTADGDPLAHRHAIPRRTTARRSHRSRRKSDDGDSDISELETVDRPAEDAGGDDDEADGSWAAGEASRSVWAGQTTTISLVSEDLVPHLERLSASVRKHVRALTRDVDDLARSASATPTSNSLRATWETLGFTLELWQE